MAVNLYREVYVESRWNVSSESLVTLPPTDHLDVAVSEHGKSSDSYEESLRAHSINYILLAFHRLGIPKLLEESKPLSLSSFVDKLGISKRYYQLVKYLFTQLEFEGFVTSVGADTWRPLAPFPEKDWLEEEVRGSETSLTSRYPERRSFIHSWANCCSALAQILRSQVDPRHHLFPSQHGGGGGGVESDKSGGGGGGGDGADFWYAEMPEAVWRDRTLEAIMRSLNFGAQARVLEVSLGRASNTTAKLFAAIGGDVEACYTLANPNPEHLRIMKTRLGEVAEESSNLLWTQPLNIEYDPKLQGFVPKSYDLVVVINCLHTVKSARNSLRNVRRLLKSNGILLLCERTEPSLGLDLTFGLLGDWWRFDDTDRQYPLLGQEQWSRLLDSSGFEVTRAFEHLESVLVGRAKAEPLQPPHTPKPPITQNQASGARSSPMPPDDSLASPWILVSNEETVRGGLEKLLLGEVGDSALILNSVPSECRVSMSRTCGGIVCICKNNTEPLVRLGDTWSTVQNVETKVLLVLITSALEEHPLFDCMTREVAHILSTIGRELIPNNKTTFTVIDYEEDGGGSGGESVDLKVFKELWVENTESWTYRFGRGTQEFERGYLSISEQNLEEEDESLSLGSKSTDYVIIQDEAWAEAETLHTLLSLIEKDGGVSSSLTPRVFKLSPTTMDSIMYELCGVHKTSSDLRIVITTTEASSVLFPLIFCFCEALTHYRSRRGLWGNLIKIGSVDGDSVGRLLDSVPISVFGKRGTFSVLDPNCTLDGAEHADGGSGVGSREGSTAQFNYLASMRNSISVGGGSNLKNIVRRKSSLATILGAKSSSEQLSLVRQVVLESVCAVTGLSQSDFEETQGFQDIGLDSVTIGDLAVRLGRAFEIELQPTSIFDHPTPQQLIAYILHTVCVDDRLRSARRESSYVLFDEDIAIVGASCRVASATSLEEFWKLLIEGADCLQPVPNSRFDYRKYADVLYNHYGSFLDDVAGFDCNFFQISPTEAQLVDPQHRLLLQLTWEALENAGIPPDSLEGSKTSVFVGMCNADYKDVVKVPEDSLAGSYLVTSNLPSVTAGRISYFLGLHGPSICVDTACSSSLVAVDLACASLRAEESMLAIVGGVNLICSPDLYIKYCGAKMLSPGRVCRPFDDGADGLVRGEAGVVLILKKMTEALTDGDSILGVIRGTGTNQDGASAGLTAPNGQAQAALIRRVMKKANLRPGDVGYIEAHGTGTALGDPIEVNALETIFGGGTNAPNSVQINNSKWSGGPRPKGPGDMPLYIGSVKANVGHTEGAAGILGLLKVCLALKYSRIPPQINVSKLNRQITNPSFFQLPRVGTRWESNKVGCVSSFGVSGTNAFAVVEQPPDVCRFRQQWGGLGSRLPPPFLLTISAKTETALTTLLDTYRNLSQFGDSSSSDSPSEQFASAAYTSNVGRAHLRYRAAVLARDQTHFHEQLQSDSYLKSPKVGQGGGVQQLCFQFTGQGSQYNGMGKELYERAPYFQEVFEDCASLVSKIQTSKETRSILDIFGDEEAEVTAVLHDPVLCQLALFSLEYSLARFWMRLGLQPSVLVGHSLGEYVAAAVAEVLSLEDALRLVELRARLINTQVQPNVAGMLAVSAPTGQELEEGTLLKELRTPSSVTVSAYNSPNQMVLSGPLQALQQAQKQLQAGGGGGGGKGLTGILLNVPYAYHSSQLSAILTEFRSGLSSMTFSKPNINIVSTVTGSLITEFDTEHWVKHLVGPVRFAQALTHVALATGLGCSAFLEVGPKPVLTNLSREILKKTEGGGGAGAFLAYSLRGGESNWTCLLNTVAQLYVLGANFNFKELYPHRLNKVPLPGYPFENIHCWSTREWTGFGAPLTLPPSSGSLEAPRQTQNMISMMSKEDKTLKGHPLTGPPVARTKKQVIWESELYVSEFPYTYLDGHAFMGKIILPGSGFVEMALEAVQFVTRRRRPTRGQQQQERGRSVVRLTEFVIALPLVLEPDVAVPTQTIATPSPESKTKGTLEINSRVVSEGGGEEETPPEWRSYVICGYEVSDGAGATTPSAIESIKRRLTCCPDVSILWSHFSSTEGVEFGASFKQTRAIWTGQSESLAEIVLQLPDDREAEVGYHVHPVLLDNAFQSAFSAFIVSGSPLIRKAFMVSSISELVLHRGPVPNHVYVHVTDLQAAEDSMAANISLLDPRTGATYLQVTGFHAQATTQDQFERLTSSELFANGLYEESWRVKSCWPSTGLAAVLNEDEGFMDEFGAIPRDVGENKLYEELCLHYIGAAMQELRLEEIFARAPGGRMTAAAFCDAAGVLSIHVHLIEHFFRHLSLQRTTAGGGARWSLTSSARALSSTLATVEKKEEAKRRLLAQSPGRALYGLVNNCGEALVGVLRGTVNQLELLFPPEETPACAAAVYKESPGINQGNQVLQRLLSKILDKMRAKEREGVELRILEIGAGTGSTTRHIMKSLGAAAASGLKFSYTYTDISASFFIGAQDVFGGGESGMLYRVLNIEEDPLGQGFAPFSYDIVIAANVLHATQCMRVTMGNARKVLRPQGLILILELTAPSLAMDLTFGLTDGWWRFSGLDDQLRPAYPLMRCATWEALLLQSQFNRVDYLELEESIILGRANGMDEFCSSPRTGSWLIRTASSMSQSVEVTRVPWLVVWFDKQPTELFTLLRTFPAIDLIQVYASSVQQVWNIPAKLGAVILDAGRCQDLRLLSENLLTLAQTLISNGTTIAQKFLVRTYGAVSMSCAEGQRRPLEVAAPFQAILWGMCKTVRTEHPELKCTAVECESWLEALEEVYSTDEEGMIVFRDHTRNVPRLRRLLALRPRSEDVATGNLFKVDRTYLVAGGLAGLGPSLVEWMYAHGARHICLVARTLRPTHTPLMPGLTLNRVQCDITDVGALERVIAGLNPPLAGVFQLAGALSDAALLSQSWEALYVAYGPKVDGTWNLHNVCLKLGVSLDYFVLFSSVASLIGSGGQVNHSSANAFMDAIAHYRRAQGLPALSINWGVWAQIGSAQGRKLNRGLEGFSPDAAYGVLERGLRSLKTQFCVSLFDWKLYDTKDSSWYSEVAIKKVAEEDGAGQATEVESNAKKVTTMDTAAPSSGGPPTTAREMQKALVAVLQKLTGFGNIPLDSPFRQLGVDSLMVIEFRNRLQKLLSLTLPMTLMFEHPNVGALSTKLLEMVKASTLTNTQNSNNVRNETMNPTPPSNNNNNTTTTKTLVETKAPTVSSVGIKPIESSPVENKLIKNSLKEPLPRFESFPNNSIQVNGYVEVEEPNLLPTPPPKKQALEPTFVYTNDANSTNASDSKAVESKEVDKKVEKQEKVENVPITWDSNDVAVIGVACKIGGADSPDSLWDMLITGKHSVTRIPSSRQELASYYDETVGQGQRPFGSFIQHHNEFDAPFFHVSDAEANLMDPQQRLLLQLSWHALEDAGIPPELLKGTKTGFFLGISGHDYAHLLTRAEAGFGANDPKEAPFWNVLGNAHCIAAGRISQILGFQGPSMAVDTACSSSLVALHLGVQALRTGQVDTVLVGGSNLLLSPDKYVGYTRGGLLSSDGASRSFDAAATGFVRGEGVAVVVLRRAVDSEFSLAIIKGTAVAHSGLGAGLGTPSGSAQTALIRQALADAQIEPGLVDYVEAQGTGSRLGDAVEVNSLDAVFGTNRERPLLVGAAKPNVGHLEACAGLGGLIKVIMCMAHRQIPPVLHLETLNPDITNPGFLTIPRGVPAKWPSGAQMTAGLASMGYAGTNAFAILQNGVKKHGSLNAAEMIPPPFLFPVSGRSGPAFTTLVQAYRELIGGVEEVEHEQDEATFLPCLAFSLTTLRSHHSGFRNGIVALTRDQLVQKLRVHGSTLPRPIQARPPQPTLIHVGGALQLSSALLETIPVFMKHRKTLVRSASANGFRAEHLLPMVPQSGCVGTSMTPNNVVHEFCSQYILVAALLDLGLIPEQLSGSGIGELVAAIHTGLVRLDESWRLVKSAAGLKKEVSFSRTDSAELVQVRRRGSGGDDASQNMMLNGVVIEFKSGLDPGNLSRLGSTRYWVDKCRGAGRDQPQPFTIFLDEEDNVTPNKQIIGDWPSLVIALGEFYNGGMNLKLELLYDPVHYDRIELPRYPFQPTRHWYK